MKPRQRTPSIFVTHDGEQLSIQQLSERVGVTYETLLNRYNRGERGAELVRPSRHANRRNHQELNDLKQLANLKAAAKAKVESLKRERAARLKAARAQMMVEHARAFSQPLIDTKLLKPKERLAILERVKYCGQRCWRSDGGAKF